MNDGARVAIVTGAGSGIGRAVARALIGANYSIAVAGRRMAPLEETLAGTGDTASFAVPTDVTDERAVRVMFAAVSERFGRVDLVFNNAGTFGPTASIEDYSWEAWRSVIDLNLNGAFLVAREAFRMMSTQRPSGGRIINNGSLSAQVPRPHAIAYTASKHAITGLTRALALEGRPRGITSGQIDIGNAATDLTDGFTDAALQADGSREAEPTISVSDIGRAILMMADLPKDANVLSLTMMAAGMPFVGRG